jgi:hypothetical protein
MNRLPVVVLQRAAQLEREAALPKQRYPRLLSVKEGLVNKAWNLTQDILISWLSFVAAIYVSLTTLSHIARADLKDWQPAFYSFLPMVFFFVGWGIFMNRREIRNLRETITSFRGSAS